MNIKLNEEKGFTLLESLLVLSLASILLIAVFTTLPPVYANTSVRQAAWQLKNDIMLAQQTSISTHQRTNILFHRNEYQVVMGDKVIERPYTTGLSIEPLTLKNRLEFNEKGHPNAGGKIRIKGHAVYDITIFLGSGTVNVERK
ncbi:MULTISPECIES: competence type IV pilus minor pilin ComGD [unclassified Bacillus (in: firmicutes)]|uniref:competence type IV pilus minor pilin ComGD n=1 Tax=unclassified Bacillus (in: firmicutes) TaxID=185979 RepID=UPI00227EBBAA|nr:prepilin-type N-terminal cleavage/methylation domain-containing protein [Bacillus sp. S20C3]MCY8205112.1 prepilin-type N-terminal cleavage/methylation domain-containing protein [Bacillus sp. N12A5]MCY8289529.1 prepilin-type N-terminal cleavage/methylation domain-containing protein [Bacillus sp. N13C7]MCY8638016.1 prepilin-type N-terminal cleavage/methylation domain-containing protein [Bacillus sp. S17B2]MCY8719078.1 prepilin-type N-terminal cleavage/methylation domain-containing protein [Bac